MPAGVSKFLTSSGAAQRVRASSTRRSIAAGRTRHSLDTGRKTLEAIQQETAEEIKRLLKRSLPIAVRDTICVYGQDRAARLAGQHAVDPALPGVEEVVERLIKAARAGGSGDVAGHGFAKRASARNRDAEIVEVSDPDECDRDSVDSGAGSLSLLQIPFSVLLALPVRWVHR